MVLRLCNLENTMMATILTNDLEPFNLAKKKKSHRNDMSYFILQREALRKSKDSYKRERE